ncbi:hypothetical protein V5P93_002792 [Actinokineospora auranticolor]|uniref:Secreted protein n=1 Tax=Actinokineospora auranticolor TaxID=155976 RepID=A0A2S6H0A5_9PSEU|nr:hypothetical protein [Actinokineospora auranticolor]PPK70932.1 hypothetical protein CLV40_101118 [Actinokineospora auranticolor]
MEVRDWQEVFGVIGVFVLLTCVITVTIWQVAVTARAKAAIAREAAYQDLAQRSVRAQEDVVRELVETREQLADLRARMGGVEHVLREVE